MISVSGHNWEELTVNKRILEKFRIENSFSEIISKLIILRNFDKTEIFSLKNNKKTLQLIVKDVIQLPNNA